MNTNNVQQGTNSSTLAKGQKIWVEGIINQHCPDIGAYSVNIYGADIYIAFDNAYTTEQILLKYGTLAPQNAEQTAQNAEQTAQNAEQTAQNAEQTAQNAEQTAQNAEQTAQNAECWVRAEFVTTTSDDSKAVKFSDCEENQHIIFMDEEDVLFNEPTHSTAVIELAEPDRTRTFRKGDKVQRRKELEGRDLSETCPELPFDVIFTVLEDENEAWNIKVKWGDKTAQGGFVYFELVEPAPEKKYWIREFTSSYQIESKGVYGQDIAINTMHKNHYTLEEAKAECDRLNQKGRRK